MALLAARALLPFTVLSSSRRSLTHPSPIRSTLRASSRSPQATAMDGVDPRAAAIMEYWFGNGWANGSKTDFNPDCFKKWYFGGPTADAEIKEKFLSLLDEAAAGRLDPWIEHPINAVAGVILMDQFSRNVFRGTVQAFALDSKALTWAKHLLDTGRCAHLPYVQQLFLWMALEHSESIDDQDRCVSLQAAAKAEADALVQAGDAAAAPVTDLLGKCVDYAIRHRDVVAKWGRFPHRNIILGRESTPEEIAGLADGSIAKF